MNYLCTGTEPKRERKHKEHRDKEHHHHKEHRDKEHHHHKDKEHKKSASPRHTIESVTVQQREHEHVINVTNKDDDYGEVTVSNYYAPNGNGVVRSGLDGFIVKSTDLSSPVVTIPIPGIKRVDSESDVYSSQVNSPLMSSGTKVSHRAVRVTRAHRLRSSHCRVQRVRHYSHWPRLALLKVNLAERCRKLSGRNSY